MKPHSAKWSTKVTSLGKSIRWERQSLIQSMTRANHHEGTSPDFSPGYCSTRQSFTPEIYLDTCRTEMGSIDQVDWLRFQVNAWWSPSAFCVTWAAQFQSFLFRRCYRGGLRTMKMIYRWSWLSVASLMNSLLWRA